MTDFQKFKAKGKQFKIGNQEIINLPRLNQSEHDAFYNSLQHNNENPNIVAEFNPNSKIYTYVIKKKKGEIVFSFQQKRKYCKRTN